MGFVLLVLHACMLSTARVNAFFPTTANLKNLYSSIAAASNNLLSKVLCILGTDGRLILSPLYYKENAL